MEKEPKSEMNEEQVMSIYEPESGDNINVVAEKIISLAKETSGSAKAEFNGIELIASEGSTVENIVSGFREKIAEAREAYLNSPEGQHMVRESEEKKEEAESKVDDLVERLPNLDFSNQEAVLDWICELQDQSESISVAKYQGDVLNIFAEHGYQSGVNTGEAFNADDQDNFARYIIGQALNDMRNDGAIREGVNKFTEEWKEKFAS